MNDVERVKKAGFDQYFPSASWEEANRSFFDQLAPKYDSLNEVISLGQIKRFRQASIQSLPLKPGCRILDICTGSGDMAIDISKRCREVKIDAVDLSDEMLNLARNKVNQLGMRNISFQKANALALPFDEHSFDCVMMGFGLRNLKDIPAGLREMHRVLKPGGVFTLLDLGKPQGHLDRFLYQVYFETLMPWLGGVLFHRNEFNSFAYLSHSNKSFPEPGMIMKLLQEAGFKDVYFRSFMFGGVAQLTGKKA